MTFRLLLFVLLSVTLLLADDETVLKQRVETRATTVDALRTGCLAREDADGQLRAIGSLDAHQNQTVQEENRDRQAIFEIIAKRTRLSPDDVAKKFGERAQKQKLNCTVPSLAAYPCELKPMPAADVARLLQYLKQGMNYASQKRADLALAEFDQVVKIDPNFLGAEMNIGSAYLVQKKYSDAEMAFVKELKLIGCLKQMNDDQLSKFAYMDEAGPQPLGQKEKAQSGILRNHLSRAEADVHYNFAWLHAKQNQNEGAFAELQKALADGFIDKKSLLTDPDLRSIRSTEK